MLHLQSVHVLVWVEWCTNPAGGAPVLLRALTLTPAQEQSCVLSSHSRLCLLS